ncbi:hypothetical protein GA0115246_114722 [Streptomyces sp. SolWspMP-sol7th]|nr:hypothetical protein GA0115246_114722 [Streptomyces sp. SolWspMP-sol7th]
MGSVSSVRGGLRRSAREPETVVALSLPCPEPSLPVTFLLPHAPLTRRSSKALETEPLAVSASTVASPGCGRRIATCPDTLVSRMSAGVSPGARSRMMSPLTESARTEGPVPSTTVRVPVTEAKRSGPLVACASKAPETVSASTAPLRRVSVAPPETLCTTSGASSPETVTPAPATCTSTWVSAGTTSETTACRSRTREESHLSGPRHGTSGYSTVSTPSAVLTSSGGPSTSATWRPIPAPGPGRPTTLTSPPMSPTRTVRTGSSILSFRASATDHSAMPNLPVLPSYVCHSYVSRAVRAGAAYRQHATGASRHIAFSSEHDISRIVGVKCGAAAIRRGTGKGRGATEGRRRRAVRGGPS